MGEISDKDRFVFSEASKTVLNNFTREQQERIGELAIELNSILDDAKKREKERVAKAGR
jgi:hypothetical protein